MDNDGYICDFELHDMLKEVGCPKPGYMVREIIKGLDRNNDKKISFEEFLAVGLKLHLKTVIRAVFH
uniref:EF-hand domain-containing protein n=1 Tax=Mola mola TaxID=94237 RepID=A0A3Q3X184_MOLML